MVGSRVLRLELTASFCCESGLFVVVFEFLNFESCFCCTLGKTDPVGGIPAVRNQVS